MSHLKKLIILVLIIFCQTYLVQANQPDILINEIAWMGTEQSANHEWIELKNNTGQEIDLNNWQLTSTDNSPQITLQGKIAPYGYFLLERTDDQTLPGIPADQIYTGALNNSGETLKLFDPDNNLIDSVEASNEWPAGDNQTKQTMERTEGGWQTSQNAGGAPGSVNSAGQPAEQSPAETTAADQPEQPLATTTPPEGKTSQPANRAPIAQAGPDINALTNQIIKFDAANSSDPDNDSLSYFWNFGDGATDNRATTSHYYQYPGEYLAVLEVSDGQLTDLDPVKITIYSDSIIISEFIPDPEGDDRQNEWIEIYNQSQQTADLSNWQLDDAPGGSKPFIFPKNTLIGSKQFIVLQRTTTKLTLNNDQDQVRLLYPDGNLSAEISYFADKKQGQSIAFDGNDYFWTTLPTPGTANIISSEQSRPTAEYLSNNPNLTPKTGQEPKQDIIAISQSQNYQTSQPDLEKDLQTGDQNQIIAQAGEKSNQAASIYPDVGQKQNAKLILWLSILISGCLLISWGVILAGKKGSGLDKINR